MKHHRFAQTWRTLKTANIHTSATAELWALSIACLMVAGFMVWGVNLLCD